MPILSAHERSSYYAEGEDGEEQGSVLLYEQISLLLLSRMIQRQKLRGFLKEYIKVTPCIPVSSLHMLQILFRTGSRSASVTNKARMGRGKDFLNHSDSLYQKTIRLMALSALCDIVIFRGIEFSYIDNFRGETAEEDDNSYIISEMRDMEIDIANKALNFLLWSSVDADFDVRSKAVSVICT
jgi:hypothetical protein